MAKGIKNDITIYYLREFIFPNNKRLFNISKRPNFRLNDFDKSKIRKLFEDVGIDNVEMRIVTASTDIDTIKEEFKVMVERYYTTNPDKGYNKQTTSNYGKSHIDAPDSVRKAQAERRKRAVVAFHLDHTVVGYFESLKSAAELLKVDQSHISKSCRGMYESPSKYIFRYFDDIVTYYWED